MLRPMSLAILIVAAVNGCAVARTDEADKQAYENALSLCVGAYDVHSDACRDTCINAPLKGVILGDTAAEERAGKAMKVCFAQLADCQIVKPCVEAFAAHDKGNNAEFTYYGELCIQSLIRNDPVCGSSLVGDMDRQVTALRAALAANSGSRSTRGQAH